VKGGEKNQGGKESVLGKLLREREHRDRGKKKKLGDASIGEKKKSPPPKKKVNVEGGGNLEKKKPRREKKESMRKKKHLFDRTQTYLEWGKRHVYWEKKRADLEGGINKRKNTG